MFVKTFDRFIDCLNVRSMSESIRSRKPDLRPYRSPDDPRLQVSYHITIATMFKFDAYVNLQWLKEDFLGYLDEWEDSVEQRKGFTASQKAMMLLSRETIEGLRTTGRISFLEYTLSAMNNYFKQNLFSALLH